MADTRDIELEVRFNIEAGLGIHTFVGFLISDVDWPREVSVRVPMDGSGPKVVMTMMGRPEGQGAVLGLADRDDVRQCLKAFLEGKNMDFEVHTASGENLIRLPLPNDSTFKAAYTAGYEKVRAADKANFPDGFMGKLNRS
jgi:hypothetical protein